MDQLLEFGTDFQDERPAAAVDLERELIAVDFDLAGCRDLELRNGETGFLEERAELEGVEAFARFRANYGPTRAEVEFGGGNAIQAL